MRRAANPDQRAAASRAAGLCLALLLIAAPLSADDEAAAVTVEMETSLGTIVLELYPAEAPRTVENFLRYAADDFYAGTIFHRVIPGFMIQGGGLEPGLERRQPRDPVVNEADNGLSNEYLTVAMARRRDPDSATSQFFINVADNPELDPRDDRAGYTVFGRVVEGEDTVERIARVETTRRGGRRNVPREPVIIEAVTRR